MVQKILILGLIKEGPKHGYEIKKIIKEEFGIFSSLSSVSIYYPLKIMEQEGLIVKKSGRGRKHLEKYVYEITPKGERTLEKMLLDNLLSHQRPFLAVDISLYFLPFLDKEEVLARLRLRGRFLESVKRWLEDKISEDSYRSHLKLLLQHHLNLAQAEEKFVRDMLSWIRNN